MPPEGVTSRTLPDETNTITFRAVRQARNLSAACPTSLILAVALALNVQFARADSAPDKHDVQQLRSDAAARLDRSLNRGVGLFIAEEATQEENWGFTLTGLVPTLYNSNAEQDPSDGTESFEWNPEVRLGWKRQLPNSINVSALVDVNSDRYPDASGANTDATYGRFRVQRITGTDDQEFQPFFEYSPRLIFTPFFEHTSSTSHDFRFGVDKLYNFDGAWHPIGHNRDTSERTVWSLALTTDLWRRHTNSGPSSTRVEIDPSLTWYPPGKPWSVSFELDILPTWYDESTDGSRYATSTTAIITYEYAPMAWSWDKQNRTLKIDFQIVYSRVDSADVSIAFKQWAIGPMIKGAVSF
jgi:hypothetical protein